MYLNRIFLANSADPDQPAPRGAVSPGSTLFLNYFINHAMTKLYIKI